jgi:hypothetical protein
MSFIEAAPSLGDHGLGGGFASSALICLGMKPADDGDFLALMGGKFRAAAAVIDGGRFLALLDHLGEQREDFVVADASRLSGAPAMSRSLSAASTRRKVETRRGVLRLHRLFS